MNPNPSATPSLVVDASEPSCNGRFPTPGTHWGFPLDFLVPRELDAVLLVGKCCQHTVLSSILAQDHYYLLFTDHKPPTYTLHTMSDRYSPREGRHSNYISPFMSDLRHITGKSNRVADVLSCPQLNDVFYLPAMAQSQAQDKSSNQAPHSSSLQCR